MLMMCWMLKFYVDEVPYVKLDLRVDVDIEVEIDVVDVVLAVQAKWSRLMLFDVEVVDEIVDVGFEVAVVVEFDIA
eukprot:167205-Amphidinium_carterae.1